MNLLTEFQRGYLAGILDGEGCITAGLCKPKGGWKTRDLSLRPATVRVMVCFSNSSHAMLTVLHGWTGIGRMVEVKNTWYQNARPMWQYVIGSQQEMLDFLVEIVTGLVIKRRQADLMIDYLRSRIFRKEGAKWPPVNEHELSIIRKIRTLNNSVGKKPGSQKE